MLAAIRFFVPVALVGLAGSASAAQCDPALQVCDAAEIEQEMNEASQRGFAFIQAKSTRKKRSKAKAAQLKEQVSAYDDIVKEQVEKLTAKHGHGSVSHKRTVVQFTAEDESD
mmetsp:Transcript_135887/g.378690  ORF Transcript_135887/g.378690 Transcript_135887/m.378690 type:complete len:113 (+) Transcript_135887:90-428(+)|eukprot:CAMPEP_0179140616 /NCGR_PEP_ID=MMETSP0796-20121207/67354_1 /TAXON_ID=73915 /ORGANISM="Pyrodinium bahamense, Strain pbaha01" /LENGTH=112 /DNA_ID=CAMNT_0020840197 /DNA_START=90 /DNA_END=428 /DNA_ORIENTATION=-